MSGDVIHASKSSGILRLDKRLERPTPSDGQRLIDNPDVFAVMKDQLILGAGDAAHMANDIFGAQWWPQAPLNKADILRAAYIKAVELATQPLPAAPAKPIVTYHIKGMDKDVFEAVVTATDREVHVLWMTPSVPMPAAPPQQRPPLEEQDVWLIGSAQRVASVRNRYLTLGYADAEIPSSDPIGGIADVSVMNCPTY
jgi:hypothetical protein